MAVLNVESLQNYIAGSGVTANKVVGANQHWGEMVQYAARALEDAVKFFGLEGNDIPVEMHDKVLAKACEIIEVMAKGEKDETIK